MKFDTIAAISTPLGHGAIGIVRLSGDDAFNILAKIFKGNKEFKTHTITYGHIYFQNELLDEVLVGVMHAPNTFTRENVVEINCHGGIKSVERVLNAVIKSGARLAEAGEFTKRAFLNGRIDLVQAESVIDIINSKTNIAQKIAVNMLAGKLSDSVGILREKILMMMASIEASIDYPEDDLQTQNIEKIKIDAQQILDKLNDILAKASGTKLLKDGIDTVILGRPNVGKSSILNIILEEERAIVTDIAGTTRDIIKDRVDIHGLPINIIDTAGIRESDDVIEKIGIEKSLAHAKDADLVLLVTDSQASDHQDFNEILANIEGKRTIIIVNKTDLGLTVTENDFGNYPVVFVSAKENSGFDKLYETISNLYQDINITEEFVLANARHKELLEEAFASISTALETAQSGLSEDFISIDLQNAYSSLGAIIGEEVNEDIIDKIFAEFCLGK